MEATVSYLLAKKMYQFKAKDLEIKWYLLCLGNLSKDFTSTIKKKCKRFSVGYTPIDTNDNLDIHRYVIWWKKRNININNINILMFGIIKKMFIVL